MLNKIAVFVVFCISPLFVTGQFTWEHTSGPFGSSESRIFSNETYAFIPEGDFLFRSADGIEWEIIIREVSDFMFVNHDTLLNVIKYQNTLLLQFSFDNGINWVIKDLPDGVSEFGDVVMCSHGIYFAQGSMSKVFKSTDIGTTWDSLSTVVPFKNMTVFENKIYISGDTLLWRTDQNGENWIDITPPLPPYYPQIHYLQDFVAADSHLIIYAADSLFLSHDNGQSWNSTYAFSPNQYDIMTFVEDAIYLNSIGVLLRSNDFGINWDTLVTHFYPHAYYFTGLRDLFLGTTFDRGVIRWDESMNKIVESNEGLSQGRIYDLAYGSGKIWAACGNGVFAYEILTDAWSNKMDLPVPLFDYRTISANNLGWIIASENHAYQFFFSQDQGASWDTINTPIGIIKLQLVGDYIYVFSNEIIRSVDKGQNWDTLSLYVLNDEILTFNNKNYLFGPGWVYESVNNGLTWNSIQSSRAFNYVFSSQDYLFAIDSDFISETEIYKSQDAIHWELVDDGLPEIEPFTLWYHYHPLFFKDANAYYAFLCDAGHYISSDGPSTWSAFETTLTGSDYLIHENVIYLGREGMYKSIIEDPFITSVKNEFEHDKDILSVSPNPVIDFILVDLQQSEFPGDVTLSLYDSKGVFLKSSTYSSIENIRMDVHDLPSGIYFLQACIKDHSGMVKIVKQ